MFKGWSVNLSIAGSNYASEIELPVPELFRTGLGPILEVVFWSKLTNRWIHGVSDYFVRDLPEGHVQVTMGDLAWVRQVVSRAGTVGLIECIEDLEQCMMPSME